MRNFFTFLLQRQVKLSPHRWLILFLFTLGLTISTHRVNAQTANNAPPELRNLLAQVDTAATRGDVKGVLQFYSPSFTNSDGINRQNLEKALTSLWQRHPRLQYRTQVQSWKREGNALIVEIVTTITGAAAANSNNMALNSTIRSRQRVEANKIVRQEILSERTVLTSGAKPPTVDLKLPERVNAGQQYSFDAVVQEPLGDDYLLGAAIDEPIQAAKYFSPTPVDLELLTAGGIFKVGRAPAQAENRWVSAVLVRGDGMTMITQRLQVVGGRNRPATPQRQGR
jgi:hypothetical protein